MGKGVARGARRGPGMTKPRGTFGEAGRTTGSRSMDSVPGHTVSVAAILTKLANDPNAGAQARASAARTLAEIQGLLGRHQAKPDRTGETPIDELTREELAQELSRLRSRVA